MKEQLINKLNSELLSQFNDKNLVLGDGSIDSRVILIGEAPGAKEVELKKPFVGQAGKYLEEFLNIIKLDRTQLYITNTVKFRPTKESNKTGRKINRPPTKEEINSFKEYLYKEIDIIKPELIVTLGNVPLKTVAKNQSTTIGELHGKEIITEIKSIDYRLFPLYHPAAVIYKRELRSTYLEDLRKLKEALDENGAI